MSDQIFWYVTRSAALVAWVTSSVAVLSGLLTSSRLLGRRPTIPWLIDIHRHLSAMSMAFLAVHMISLWADAFVAFSPAELLIPWVATVPGLSRTSLALGVIAAWLLALVQLTSLVKDRLPESVWHTVHLGSFGTLVFGTIHAVLAGSDTTNPIVVALGVSVLTAIGFATFGRVHRYRQQLDAPAVSAITTTGQHHVIEPPPDAEQPADPHLELAHEHSLYDSAQAWHDPVEPRYDAYDPVEPRFDPATYDPVEPRFDPDAYEPVHASPEPVEPRYDDAAHEPIEPHFDPDAYEPVHASREPVEPRYDDAAREPVEPAERSGHRNGAPPPLDRRHRPRRTPTGQVPAVRPPSNRPLPPPLG